MIIFLGFLIFLHYLREMNDRRVYTMRAELKVSYKAKQRAQINERKQLDAKRRFSSCAYTLATCYPRNRTPDAVRRQISSTRYACRSIPPFWRCRT